MANVPKGDEDDDEDDEDDEDDDEEDDEDDDEEDDEDALRGLRFFMNNLTGVEHDEADIADETAFEANHGHPGLPGIAYIAQKLRESGMTFEHLIQLRLATFHDEYQFGRNERILDDAIFRRISDAIESFAPGQQEQVEQQDGEQQENVDYSAQPKHGERPIALRVHV